ncbi:autophagy associated lipase Atg15 [Schizosaccharomyces japonicus yFS275]|uniref:triacylglycerol lipase n=1 Tax=Schizosaccharomyces japonicus (strain yFS275 / FY16936) TaxID=402676 RepID=B6JZQ5_SCHJY|nr:autophagy associated lipase Atg15 [Schizosaccharomyces japonicus yFS275]EEB07023.1 autophagy associated lipase Atg15 [Schizosaccharomyces japonicus yFS275]
MTTYKVFFILIISFIVFACFFSNSSLLPHLYAKQGPTSFNTSAFDSNVTSDAFRDEFRLQYVFYHGVNEYYDFHARLDTSGKAFFAESESTFTLKGIEKRTVRLKDLSREGLKAYRRASQTNELHAYDADLWREETIIVPDIKDKQTIYALGKMSYNAYIEIPFDDDWLDLGSNWNITPPYGFGWEDNGLRGHVFANSDNTTVIVAMKGTSIFGIGRGTSQKDRINDNLLFSCCCARVSWAWTTVCDCYRGTYTCSQTCLEDELQSDARYYSAALDIFYNITQLYPNAVVWMTGHSLGGATAALMGLSFGIPTVTFEAPGDRLAARRLHLPQPPGLPDEDSLVWHIGHTADPIYLGTCTGPTSSCWAGGYAMESQCHTGLECIYDVVKDKGWRISIAHHRMQAVLQDVIDSYDEIPTCVSIEDCDDCYLWDFKDED